VVIPPRLGSTTRLALGPWSVVSASPRTLSLALVRDAGNGARHAPLLAQLGPRHAPGGYSNAPTMLKARCAPAA
jgi:hypothetical protein